MFSFLPLLALKTFEALIEESTKERTEIDTKLVSHLVQNQIKKEVGTIEEKVAKEEFNCPCCGINNVNEELLAALNLARHTAGIPFKITSGVRCLRQNRKIGSKDTSSHLFGNAGDIRTRKAQETYIIMMALIGAGINRIGIYDHHVHADNDPNKPKNCLWIGTSK